MVPRWRARWRRALAEGAALGYCWDERPTLGDLVAVIRAVSSWVLVAAMVRWAAVRAAAALGALADRRLTGAPRA